MFGAVITFPAGTTREEAEAFFKAAAEATGIEVSASVNEFDGAYGGPVGYLP